MKRLDRQQDGRLHGVHCRGPATARRRRIAAGARSVRPVTRRDEPSPARRACSAGRSGPTSRRPGRSCRGTVRRRWRGTSPPTTAGTRRPTRSPCARSGCSGRRSTRPRAHPRWRRRAAGVVGGRRRWPHARRGHQRVAAADRLRLHARRPADGPTAGRRPDRGHRPAGSTIVLPIGHRSSVTVALAHAGTGAGSAAAGSLAVGRDGTRGWVARSRRRAGSSLPDERAGGGAGHGAGRRCSSTDRPTPATIRRSPARPRSSWSGSASSTARPLDDAVPDVAAAVAGPRPPTGWDVDAALAAAAMRCSPGRVSSGRRATSSASGRPTTAARRPPATSTASGPSRRSSGGWPPTACCCRAASPPRGWVSTSRRTACRSVRRRRCRSPCGGTARRRRAVGGRRRAGRADRPGGRPVVADRERPARRCGALISAGRSRPGGG